MRPGLLLTLLAVLLWWTAVTPSVAESLDDQPEVVSEYARAKRLMREGDYLEASRVFRQLSARFPDSRNIDLFLFNRAKADLYFGNHDEALAGFGNFIRRFPNSPFAAHAYFFQFPSP